MLTLIENFLFSTVRSSLNLTENTTNTLKRLGIITIRDLLFYRPSSYQIKTLEPDLTNIKEGQLIQITVTIEEIILPTKKHQPIKIITANASGSVMLVFFHKLPVFIFNKLKVGTNHTVSGKIQFFDHHLQITHPEFIYNSKFEKAIEPIYPLTYGIINKQIYLYILKALDIFEEKFKIVKKADVRNYIAELINNLKALHLSNVHISEKEINDQISKCVKQLAEKELIANQISLYNIRRQIQLRSGNSFLKAVNLQRSILNGLGFELTIDQRKVIAEIEQDQESSTQMMRLLQGDVGSGKTLVALLTMINTVNSGFQTTLMAPTDLLAAQHYKFFIQATSNINVKLALLTGKILGNARKNILSQLENGEIDILIGTHALFQEKVNFKKLGYIVIDEQHRFGVQQRLDLISKGISSDVLVMTATPIPRSLTLTMFGDMQVSKLIGKPKNRLPIMTNTMPNTKIENIIEVLDKKLNLGERIYWICPLIDQNDKEENIEEADFKLMDATSRFKSVDLVYPNLVGIIHGKMKNDQKDIVMQQFKEGKIKLLIATTVIEVGIDVPEATLIIIENAEQFGLAQLHQLRGRVGRGSLPSYCILLYNSKRLSAVARNRLTIMKQTNDGFYIAEEDLKLRGGGEILGVKQSGEAQFFFADLAKDLELLIKANKLAENDSDTSQDLINFQIKLFTKSIKGNLN